MWERSVAWVLAAVTACGFTACAPVRRSVTVPPAAPTTYEVHRYYINFIPFGAGQLQNGERGKGFGFAIAEGLTGAASAGIWLYLVDHYPDGRVPPDEAQRVHRLQEVELGTGIAFFGLAAWGIIDSLAHYAPEVEIRDTDVTLVPALVPGGAGVALRWSR